MKYRVDKVNSWNGWDPLKQVILGNCFSPEWFRDIKDSSLRKMIQTLVSDTIEDLDGIQQTLENLGVDVVRIPQNTIIDGTNLDDDGIDSWGKYYQYIQDNNLDWRRKQWRNGLPKPMITPRDYWITLGNSFVQTSNVAGIDSLAKRGIINPDIIFKGFSNEVRENQWERDGYPSKGPLELSSAYKKEIAPNWIPEWDNPEKTIYSRFDNAEYMEYIFNTWGFWAPVITRVGDTLVVDQEEFSNLGKVMLEMFPEFKQTHTAIGGHNDATFSPVRPGHIVTAPWHVDYSKTFPDWKIHTVTTNEKMDFSFWQQWESKKTGKLSLGQWWQEGAEAHPEYIKFVDEWMNKWVGQVEETVFEVNMLSVSPDTILCLNKNEKVHEHLRSIGLDPIYCRFRNRHFWDGGLHCLTVDTIREGGKQNYF